MAQNSNDFAVDSRSGYCQANSIFYSKRKPIPFPANEALDVTTFISSRTHSGKIAFIDATTGRSLTFSDVWNAVESLATSLSDNMGIRKGHVVLLLSPNSIFFPIICLAVMSLGAIITTTNPLNTKNEIAKQIKDSNPVLAFTIPQLLPKLTGSNLPVILIDGMGGFSSNLNLKIVGDLQKLIQKKPRESRLKERVTQNDTATLLYSSGTTGASKGVISSHRNLIAMVQTIVGRFMPDEGEQTFICTVPMFHIYGLAAFATGFLASGSTVIVLSKFDMDEMLSSIHKYKATSLPLVPPILIALVNNADSIRKKYDLSSLTSVLSGGAPLSKEVIEGFVEKYPSVKILQGYGLTESTGIGASTDSLEESRKYGTAGMLSPSMEAKIVDPESGEAFPVNKTGELWLRGPTIMKFFPSVHLFCFRINHLQQNQVKAIIYGDDISLYQQRFTLFNTYLITSARVQQPTLRYEKPLHTYEWIIDRKTIVDSIDKDETYETTVNPSDPKDFDADAMPPPTIINMTSFQEINEEASRCTKEQLRNTEFNVLAIVVNCFPPRYVASMQKRLQELIVIDTSKQALTFTLWEETIIEDEGTTLLTQFPKHPIIFARRVGVSKYNGTSLTTKFNTTIQIDPPYSQCVQLQSWIATNTEMLNSFAIRSTSQSGALISAPVEEKIVPIANIQTQQDGQTFTIEARITAPKNYNSCYVLACPNCRQEVRNLKKRKFHCTNCNQQNMLSPRCRFEVNLDDASGSTRGIIMDEQAEQLLSLTAEEIYTRASTEVHSDSEEHDQPHIQDDLLKIKVKKSFSRSARPGSTKVLILAIIPNAPSSSKRPKKNIISSDEETAETKEKSDTLRLKGKMEPPTPTKQ